VPDHGTERSMRRPSGPSVGEIVIDVSLDPYLSLRALASYSGLSVRTLRGYLADPTHPLPCYRVGGKLLVRRSEFDAWIAAFREYGRTDVTEVVEEVLRDLQ
jgi:excisionase family DNA binding protein